MSAGVASAPAQTPSSGGPKPIRRAHCELDDWDFDPRYTNGACPICGWTVEGAIKPTPEWLLRLQRLPWDYIGLGVLLIVLVALGIVVGAAAGMSLLPKGY